MVCGCRLRSTGASDLSTYRRDRRTLDQHHLLHAARIQGNFKLWPNNYIAYDLLHSTNKFASKYNEEEKENFIRVMAEKLEKLEGNRSILNNIFLEIYANPVKNSIEHNYSSPVCE